MVDIDDAESTEIRDNDVVIIGTAHVSEKSVEDVTTAIEDLKPDIVAVELCDSRYRSLTGQEETGEIQIKELLSGNKLYLLLIQLSLAYIQKKIGAEVGVKPGSDMIAAINTAHKMGARVALVDRDIGVTIQRFWSSMRFREKVKLIASLIPAAFGRGGEEIDMDEITQDDVVAQVIEEFRKISPRAAQVLIDERDAYIARNLIRLSGSGKVVAVVGAGHREGISRYLANPETVPELDVMVKLPDKRLSLPKLVGVAMMLLVVITLVAVLLSGFSTQNIFAALKIWFLVNGVLSALGVVLARGHPLSVMTAFSVAWITSLNPLIAAGWFAGLVEAWKRKPTMGDMKGMGEAETFGELMKIPLFRVILVAALANIGSVAGTVLGSYLILRMVEISPKELIGGIL
ncbi:MAG: TraB/GumN family protein [Methanothrix sp.]|nr:MAG: TraB/GumN family protein [Methanothrix sp.]